MVKLSAHLGYQFTEVPFLDRFALAAAAGYSAVEFPAPYAYEPAQLANLLKKHGLTMVQFSTPSGKNGEKGIAALPHREAEFKESLDTALRYAEALDCKLIHPMSGATSPDSAAPNWTTYQRNMQVAARHFADSGVDMLVEVISPATVPGYYMGDFDRCAALLDSLGDTPTHLLFDTYHAQTLTGDMLNCLAQWLPRTRHIQIADHPGRHEPGTGELNFPALFTLLEQAGYKGWVGCEYHPKESTQESLASLAPYLSRSGK